MKMAMNMAVDLGLSNEEEHEEMVSMTDEQMASDTFTHVTSLADFVCSSNQ